MKGTSERMDELNEVEKGCEEEEEKSKNEMLC